MKRKWKLFLLYMPLAVVLLLVVAVFLLAVCREMNMRAQPVNPVIYIGDYVFRVEEAIGDRYNVRMRYSLKRQDGEKIAPETRFGSLSSSDGIRSMGGSYYYNLSDDGKTIWIEEEQSSSHKYDSKALHTVTLENLTFGQNSSLEPIEGTWSASYRIQINEEYTELLDSDLKIRNFEDESYYCQLTSIQLSSMGIHMVMKLPDNDIYKLAKNFKASLVLKNGAVIDLELHHSIRGKKSPFGASGETMFKESVELDEVYALIVCGQEILVNR